ncbi:MAG: hypothetical protein GF347_02080 [Candidatus Moranbacteria bacterium]|nr:hypothetical protein [Candidatus Moranbacteria bacterium]
MEIVVSIISLVVGVGGGYFLSNYILQKKNQDAKGKAKKFWKTQKNKQRIRF